MRNIGFVIEKKDNIAIIKVMRSSACGENCASCKAGCSNSGTYIEAVNTLGAQVGDRVVVTIPDNAALCAAFVAYFIPLALAVGLSVISYIIGLGENVLFFSAIIGLLIGVAVAKVLSEKFKLMFSVHITEILKHIDL